MITTTKQQTAQTLQFLTDTLEGLHAEPKHMHAKYFYDEIGDGIFQQIMDLPEYYLTNAEMEIFKEQSQRISAAIGPTDSSFDLIELGAGDATKSVHLLRALLDEGREFSYLPIDISGNVIRNLEHRLPLSLPNLQMQGFTGDYFEMLKEAVSYSNRPKVVLFMGANIGNMSVDEASAFCKKLRKYLSSADLLLIGFDLKKNPRQILSAYNDPKGITRAFNLNLLSRINRELDGNFDLDAFEHYAMYDPETGSCKSYLISLKDQQVSIGEDFVEFKANEYVFMEISQKYALDDIDEMALQCGFLPGQRFFDRNGLFVDAIWKTAEGTSGYINS